MIFGTHSRRAVARTLGALVLACVLTGCRSAGQRATPVDSPPASVVAEQEGSIVALTAELLKLDACVTAEEAGALARAAVCEARALAKDYAAIQPAWLHNSFVNLGLKSRGLCHQWADDLERQLAPLPRRQLAIRRVVAREGTRREHNALVVYVVNRPPETGIVLDAWRHGGELHWVPFTADKYPWKLVD
jgi:hypothetical protein